MYDKKNQSTEIHIASSYMKKNATEDGMNIAIMRINWEKIHSKFPSFYKPYPYCRSGGETENYLQAAMTFVYPSIICCGEIV